MRRWRYGKEKTHLGNIQSLLQDVKYYCIFFLTLFLDVNIDVNTNLYLNITMSLLSFCTNVHFTHDSTILQPQFSLSACSHVVDFT